MQEPNRTIRASNRFKGGRRFKEEEFETTIQRLAFYDLQETIQTPVSKPGNWFQLNQRTHDISQAQNLYELDQTINDLLDAGRVPQKLITNAVIIRLGELSLKQGKLSLMQFALKVHANAVKNGRADAFTYESTLKILANMVYPNLNEASRLIAEAEGAGIQFAYPTYTKNGVIDFQGVCFGISYFWLRNEILRKRQEQEYILLALDFGKRFHLKPTNGSYHPIYDAVSKAIKDEASVKKVCDTDETLGNPDLYQVTLEYLPSEDPDPIWKSHGFQQTLYWLTIDDSRNDINDTTEAQQAYREKIKQASSLETLDMILIAMMRENSIPGPRTLKSCLKKLDQLGHLTYCYDLCHIAVHRAHNKSLKHSIYSSTLDIIAKSKKPDFEEADTIFKSADKFGVKFNDPEINKKTDQITFKNMSLGEIYFWLRKNFLVAEKAKSFYLNFAGEIENFSVQEIIKKAMEESGRHIQINSVKPGMMRLTVHPAVLAESKKTEAAVSTLPVLPPPSSRAKKETSSSPTHSSGSNNSNKENELKGSHSRLFQKPPRDKSVNAPAHPISVQARRRVEPG